MHWIQYDQKKRKSASQTENKIAMLFRTPRRAIPSSHVLVHSSKPASWEGKYPNEAAFPGSHWKINIVWMIQTNNFNTGGLTGRQTKLCSTFMFRSCSQIDLNFLMRLFYLEDGLCFILWFILNTRLWKRGRKRKESHKFSIERNGIEATGTVVYSCAHERKISCSSMKRFIVKVDLPFRTKPPSPSMLIIYQSPTERSRF